MLRSKPWHLLGLALLQRVSVLWQAHKKKLKSWWFLFGWQIGLDSITPVARWNYLVPESHNWCFRACDLRYWGVFNEKCWVIGKLNQRCWHFGMRIINGRMCLFNSCVWFDHYYLRSASIILCIICAHTNCRSIYHDFECWSSNFAFANRQVWTLSR